MRTNKCRNPIHNIYADVKSCTDEEDDTMMTTKLMTSLLFIRNYI